MEIFSLCIVLAAHHGDDGALGVIAFMLMLVGAVMIAVEQMRKAGNVNWKNGRAYCPGCGRQVSMKASRPCCRSCGYNLVQAPSVTIPSVAVTPPPIRSPAEEKALDEATRIEMAAIRKQEEERARLREEQRQIEAEAARQARELAEAEKHARLQAELEENGGYRNFQLYGIGIGIALIPACLILVLVHFALAGDGVKDAQETPQPVVAAKSKTSQKPPLPAAAEVRPTTTLPAESSEDQIPSRKPASEPGPPATSQAVASSTVTSSPTLADTSPAVASVTTRSTAPTATAPSGFAFHAPSPTTSTPDTPPAQADDRPKGNNTPYGQTATGIPTFVGPRGGVYHYSPSGRKVYEKKRR